MQADGSEHLATGHVVGLAAAAPVLCVHNATNVRQPCTRHDRKSNTQCIGFVLCTHLHQHRRLMLGELLHVNLPDHNVQLGLQNLEETTIDDGFVNVQSCECSRIIVVDVISLDEMVQCVQCRASARFIRISVC